MLVNLLPHDIKAKRKNFKPRFKLELAELKLKIIVGNRDKVNKKDNKVLSKLYN
jgi:hypothetical protein